MISPRHDPRLLRGENPGRCGPWWQRRSACLEILQGQGQLIDVRIELLGGAPKAPALQPGNLEAHPLDLELRIDELGPKNLLLRVALAEQSLQPPPAEYRVGVHPVRATAATDAPRSAATRTISRFSSSVRIRRSLEPT